MRSLRVKSHPLAASIIKIIGRDAFMIMLADKMASKIDEKERKPKGYISGSNRPKHEYRFSLYKGPEGQLAPYAFATLSMDIASAEINGKIASKTWYVNEQDIVFREVPDSFYDQVVIGEKASQVIAITSLKDRIITEKNRKSTDWRYRFKMDEGKAVLLEDIWEDQKLRENLP